MKLTIFANRCRANRWTTVAVAAFTLLSGLGVARTLARGEPLEYAAGFYAWERTPSPWDPRDRIEFRWSGSRAILRTPLEGPVLRFLLLASHPMPPPSGAIVDLTIDEDFVQRIDMAENGWREVTYYLPAVLGSARWAQVSGDAQATVRVQFEAGSPFVPANFLDSDDVRLLGIGVTAPRWQSDIPADGIGLYPLETDPQGVDFRWTGKVATTAMVARDSDISLAIRSAHPDIDQRPVRVSLLWAAEQRLTITLRDTEWYEISVHLENGPENGVLSVIVDRTWNPSQTGESADNRQLGVAVAGIW